MSYKVKLEIFEGPLDLLLYLIKKEELDIYDIPIAKITDQYLEYLDMMKLLDLAIAGEFILMAATLMQIKSRMLLPPEEAAQEEIEEEDPRSELVRKLLEYRQFKEAADRLAEKEAAANQLYIKESGKKPSFELEDGAYFEASIFDLLTAFSRILKEVPRETFHRIVKDEFTVGEKIHDIFHILVSEPKIYFSRLFTQAKSKIEIIAIFLAILELIRLKEVIVVQKDTFADIEIIRNPGAVKPVGK